MLISDILVISDQPTENVFIGGGLIYTVSTKHLDLSEFCKALVEFGSTLLSPTLTHSAIEEGEGGGAESARHFFKC